MVPFSILDLSPITEGGDAGQALRNSLDLARHVEALGYRRYWVAQEHNFPGVSRAATGGAPGHVAARTHHIPIRGGRLMLAHPTAPLFPEQCCTPPGPHP